MSLPKHILVIRLSALGDIAMTVPVLRVVAKTYPDIKLTVVSRKFAEPLFDDIPNIQFLEADVDEKHKGLGIFKLGAEAKALGIDAVADLHQVIRSKLLRKYLWLHGIKTAGLDKGRNEKNKLITSKKLLKLKSMHERYADVFAKLGMPIDLSNHEFPARRSLDQRLISFLGQTKKKAIGIAPFAAYKSKMYPLDLLKEVIQKLDAENNYIILLFGAGEEETTILKDLEHTFESVRCAAGRFSLGEELDLISNLDLMLSMDSGNGHLAAMFGVPVITLWGVTHPYLGFTPFGQPDTNQIVSNREEYPLIPTSVYGNKFPKEYTEVMRTIPSKLIVDKILATV